MTRLAIITLLAAAALCPASSFLLSAMPLSTAGRLAARSNSETRAAPAPHLVRQRRNALAPAKMSLEGGEKASKKQIFSAVIALLSSSSTGRPAGPPQPFGKIARAWGMAFRDGAKTDRSPGVVIALLSAPSPTKGP